MITTEEARRLYRGTDAVHDFDHILRVLALAVRIGHAEGADLAVVRTAVLLHDVGREAAEVDGLDHAAYAAAEAERILRNHPSDTVASVSHAIAAHRFRTSPEPSTVEAQVVFDADKLDAIGAIGVARAFAYGGAHGQRLWAPIETVDAERWRQVGDDPLVHTPVHEFAAKLRQVKDRLYTATGKALAAERHNVMVDFFARLAAEAQGED